MPEEWDRTANNCGLEQAFSQINNYAFGYFPLFKPAHDCYRIKKSNT